MREAKKVQEPHVKFDCTMVDDGENCYSFDYIFAKNSTQ